MGYDKALIAGKLRRWEKYLERFRLPAWDDIPVLPVHGADGAAAQAVS